MRHNMNISRQVERAIRREFDAEEAAQQRTEARAAKRKARGISGGSRARQFAPIDLSIEDVRDALAGARRMKGGARRRCIIKCARRLYNGEKVNQSWRSYPREGAIMEGGRIVL